LKVIAKHDSELQSNQNGFKISIAFDQKDFTSGSLSLTSKSTKSFSASQQTQVIYILFLIKLN
jgi:hypothetical protein